MRHGGGGADARQLCGWVRIRQQPRLRLRSVAPRNAVSVAYCGLERRGNARLLGRTVRGAVNVVH